MHEHYFFAKCIQICQNDFEFQDKTLKQREPRSHLMNLGYMRIIDNDHNKTLKHKY